MKSDKEIWNSKFKNGDTIKDFVVNPGPPIKDKSLLENMKLRKKKVETNTVEERLTNLEKEIKEIKKYLNYQSRNSKKNNSNIVEQPRQVNNETQAE